MSGFFSANRNKVDPELEIFRNLATAPGVFEEGFNWKSLLGALFIGFLMVPGSIYMGLLAGQSIGAAAQWVTVILFLEVARRAHVALKKSEIFVLFYMASAAMGSPFTGLLYNQFFVNSQAALATGVAPQLPAWFAPQPDSASYSMRTFLHVDWLPVIGMIVFTTVFGTLSNIVMGYGFFRLTSDVEKLPFPMAPIGVQGVLAFSEDINQKDNQDSEANWRWRVFSIGGALGLFFGAIYIGLPTITGALTGNPIMLFPIPFYDMTVKTQAILPAVPTGINWDFGEVLIGMVLPFYSVVGSFAGMVATYIANPILYHQGILKSWTVGDDTIATMFKNNVDFYFSFTIGLFVAVAVLGIINACRTLFKNQENARLDTAAVRGVTTVPKGRGDIRPKWILACYFIVVMMYVLLSGYLIHWHRGVMCVLIFFGFLYNPLISYVSARLEGIAGQVVDIPMIREASLILSGYQGVAVWFLPIPGTGFGQLATFYRQCELVGTKFTSIWKTQLLILPIVLVSSFFFMNFIWKLGDVPSAMYPFAQKMWDLNAANACIMYSSTLGEYSIFEDAFSWKLLGTGAGFGALLFSVTNCFGMSVFFAYGVVRGLGQTLPHAVIPEMIGALLGRFYFQKHMGLKWRQYVPIVAAGFACGMGLVSVLSIGITFMSKAIIQLPY